MIRSWYAIVLVPALASAQPAGPQVSSASPVEPRTLREIDETPFDTQTFEVFRGPFRCDAAGNVFFAPRVPGPENSPPILIRVPRDGTRTTRYDLARALRAEETDVAIHVFTLDIRGMPYVLASVLTPGGEGQFIVTLNDKGRLKSLVEVDNSQISPSHFAVFDSGDFMLLGSRAVTGEPSVAVMPRNGGPLRHVKRPGRVGQLDPPTGTPWLSRYTLNFVEAGPDGNAYFAPGSGPVYVITPAGEISRRFELRSPREGATLFDLKVSRGRLAAIYSSMRNDNAPTTESSSRWVVTYDLDTGVPIGSYGPVKRPIMCYFPDERHDRFALLGARDGRITFLNVSAP